MDQLFDLLPLIIGLIWFLSRGRRKKQEETPRESTEPQAESGKSLRDILEDFEREFSGGTKANPEVVMEEDAVESAEREDRTEPKETVFSYDNEVQEELKRQAEMMKKAEQDRDHHAFKNRKKENEQTSSPIQSKEEERIFNLRQAVIYDAIMRRPEF